MLTLASTIVGTLGSVFISRNETNGKVVINIAPIAVASIGFYAVGCAVDTANVPFGHCMESGLSALRDFWSSL